MANFYTRTFRTSVLLLFAFLMGGVENLTGQNFPFDSYNLVGESLVNPTSLDFGPDGRLYVAQQNGLILAYTVNRVSNGGAVSYEVVATETIDLVKNGTPNHNDDGTLNTTQNRQVTGIMLAGTAANPILYVTSSDWRISVGTDSGLDTNSGVLSRLTWNGSSWDKVDLVRGFARCEENHAINGMDLDEANNILYVMVGGNTNKGAPSNNFAGTIEYFTSAVLLAVDLDVIESMPIYIDPRSNIQYVYDLPTLNDPTRPDITKDDVDDFPYPDPTHPMHNATVDLGDPFGGNNGANMAILEPGGPVQVYSTGYRNAYDVVFTEGGKLYSIDNGPNSSWGGIPLEYDENDQLVGTVGGSLDAGHYITNEFNETESSTHGDVLTYITPPDPVSGTPYFAGHPTPIRAFPAKAGIYIYEKISGSWQATAVYNFTDLLNNVSGYFNSSLTIADFPDNPSEGIYNANNLSLPGRLDIYNASTNGICEYTASNFNGAMQGNLLTASYNGIITRYDLTDAGDDTDFIERGFFGNFGSQPLDVIAQGDNDPFPGTIWVATYGADNITIFEPSDFGNCPQIGDPDYDSFTVDSDDDGYSNGDELAAGSNICSGGSLPSDNDGDFVSDFTDTDDDNDGIPDVNDAFAIDPDNGMTTTMPIVYPFWNNDPGTGFFGVGFTGLMINGSTDYLTQFDTELMSFGGAAGKVSVDEIPAGDAYQANNDQDYAFQFGVNNGSTPFSVHAKLESPFFPDPSNGNAQTPIDFQSFGIQIGLGDQDNYLSMVLAANGGNGGIKIYLEEGGIAVSDEPPYNPDLDNDPGTTDDLLGADAVDLYLTCDPANNTVQPFLSTDNGITITPAGNPITVPGSWLDPNDNQALAVGIIATSRSSNDPFSAIWDFITVQEENPQADLAAVNPPLDFGDVAVGTPVVGQQLRVINEGGPSAGAIEITGVAIVDDNPNDGVDYSGKFSYTGPTSVTIGPGNIADLDISFLPDEIGNQTANIEITHSGDNSPLIVPVQANVLEEFVVLYRVNAGGAALSALDTPNPDWEADDANNPSPYRNAGSNIAGTDPNQIDATVPASTPPEIWSRERWDPASGEEMQWDFPVTIPGNYKVRLYLLSNCTCTNEVGERVFDVAIEGTVLLDDYDIVADVGHKVATMKEFVVPVADGNLDINFFHVVENPLINAIEILGPGDAVGPPPITVSPIPNQSDPEGTNVNLQVAASGGTDGENFQFLASNLPPGLDIEPTNGLIFGAITAGAADNSPYQVTITVSKPSDTPVDISFVWTVTDPSAGAVWNNKDENENYTARHECSFVQAGDKFYLFGGREQATKLEIYDYTTDTWTEGATVPVELNHFQATEYQGLIWVIGAFKDNNFPVETPADYIYMYDPANDLWIQGPEIPAGRKRGSAALVVYNDKFYVIGGNTIGHNGGYVSWFDEYDPQTNTWTPLTDAPRPRDHFHAAVHDDKLYVVGGRLSGGAGGTFAPLQPEVDVYDFGAQTWSTLPAASNLPTPRAASGTVNFQNKIFVIGGEGNGQAYTTTEALDPNLNTWEALDDLNHPRHGTQAIVSGDGIHILGGSPNQGGGNQKNMEYYGVDNPTGNLSDASVLSGPQSVNIIANDSEVITLENIDGNQGIVISSLSITGADAADFSIVAGDQSNFLVKAGGAYEITVANSALEAGNTADLVIDYYGGSPLSITLNGIGQPSPNPPTLDNPGDQESFESDVIALQLTFEDLDMDVLTFDATGLPPGLSVGNDGLISGVIAGNSNGVYDVTVTVSDGTNPDVPVGFTWFVYEPLASCQNILYRVNNGGGALAAGDGSSPDFSEDTDPNPSPYVSFENCGGCDVFFTTTVSIDLTHPTLVGSGATEAMLQSERWDQPFAPEMAWDFPVTSGSTIQIRLYLSELAFTGVGQRVFDVEVEGSVPDIFNDIDIYRRVGANRGLVLSHTLTMTDGNLDINFLHDLIENPKVNGIEICEVAQDEPVVDITAPQDGATITRGVLTDFAGAATDFDDGDLTDQLSWSSDTDPGFSGSGGSFQAMLIEPGVQTISATVADNDGNIGSASIQVTVPGPQVDITSPLDDATLTSTDVTLEWTYADVLTDAGEHFHIYVNPPDPNNPNFDDQISTASEPGATTWNLTAADGLMFGQNTIVIVVDRSIHTEFTNPEATDIVTFNIVDPAVPVVDITVPSDGSTITRGVTTDFTATAIDDVDGDISPSLNWSSDIDPSFSGTGGAFQTTLIEPGLQTITASVTDSDGNTGTASIQVTVPGPQVSFSAPADGSTVPSTDVTLEWTATDVLYNLTEHFHLYINPVDPDNPTFDERISTADQPGQTFWDLTAADGIVVGQNVIVIRTAQSNHSEFTNPESTDMVTFTVDPPTTGDINFTTNVLGACDGRNVTISVYDPADNSLVTSQTVTVSGGAFGLTGLATGTYDIYVKLDYHLQRALPGQTIVAGANDLAVDDLAGGDSNNDNFVDFLDFLALSASYNLSDGDQDFDPTADYNCDGTVDFLDFLALSSNYNTGGDEPNP